MKNLLMYLFSSCLFYGCSQTMYTQLVNQIYVIESQDVFFKLNSAKTASYYTINEFGNQKVTEHNATWKFLNDSTIKLNVTYQIGNNVEFILHYNKEKDYWIDSDYISVYRRMKYIEFNDFKLTE